MLIAGYAITDTTISISPGRGGDIETLRLSRYRAGTGTPPLRRPAPTADARRRAHRPVAWPTRFRASSACLGTQARLTDPPRWAPVMNHVPLRSQCIRLFGPVTPNRRGHGANHDPSVGPE